MDHIFPLRSIKFARVAIGNADMPLVDNLDDHAEMIGVFSPQDSDELSDPRRRVRIAQLTSPSLMVFSYV